MKDSYVYDYKVRSSYSNFNTINHFTKEDFSSNEELSNSYLQPEIEYTESSDSSPKTITAHFFDLTFLCQRDKEKGKEYLTHLLRANAGNRESIAIVESYRLSYKLKKQAEINSISFVENEFVVPSSTINRYNEEHISQKGAILLDLIQNLYPVPDFCVFTSSAFFLEAHQKQAHLRNVIENLEKMTATRLGDRNNPLIFAMRSATSFYIPGFLPTYLNAGINETVYHALRAKYGIVVAGKIYINNLQTIYRVLFPEDAGNEICQPVTSFTSSADIESRILILIAEIGRINSEILTDAFAQVSFLVDRMHEFFITNQDLVYTLKKGDISYPSIIMQKMVWTIRNDDSYPGVLYSRHSRTGIGQQVESVRNMFGDDIMTGTVDRTDTEFFEREEIKNTFPAIYHFVPSLPKLEALLESPVTIEFAAETRKNAHLFAILQLNTSELTGRSTLLSLIDLYKKGVISGERVIRLVQPYHLKQIFSERIDDLSHDKLTFFCNGISVLPRSAVTARIFFTTSKALEAKRNGEKVCLCKETYVPSDTIILCELDAIISLTPAAVHVVTSCLGYGVPAFINLNRYNVTLQSQSLVNKEGDILHEGDWITLSSKHQMIMKGKASYAPARFQQYIEGSAQDLLPKEEKVFVNMKAAYDQYQTIVKTLDHNEIATLNDLIKIIRNDLQKNHERASSLACCWFDSNVQLYIEQVLKSELGMHQDQHMIYDLFTTERKVSFFKQIVKLCKSRDINGYTAGSFMLGRFVCLQQPIHFWKEMDAAEIVFLLNEYILFEKYLQVLNDVGERHINRARKKILNEGISNVNLSHIDPTVFITLKLVFKEWDSIEQQYRNGYDSDTFSLIALLKRPFGYFYSYAQPWSINRLKDICDREQLPLPDVLAV